MGPLPAVGAVSTMLLLMPATPGPVGAADPLPAVSALLRGLSVPATVASDEQVCVCDAPVVGMGIAARHFVPNPPGDTLPVLLEDHFTSLAV